VVTIQVYPTQSLGGSQSGPILGTFAGELTSYAPDGFHPCTGPAVSVIGAATYALSFHGYVAFSNPSQYPFVCFPLPYDPAAVFQLPYQFVATNYCPGVLATFPPSGTVGLSVRFRAAACGPGRLASVASLGGACGWPAGGPSASIWSYTPPVLGSQWPLTVNGAAGTTALLFWSGGVNPAGSPITAGSPCLFYLDAQSVASLAQLGAEPLFTAMLPSPTPTWTIPLPSFPGYAGLVIGIQCALVGSGTIPLGGGTFFQTTNALQLTLGY
jgi:hypothetical protein